jgi:delta1-piperideine-2-carboxylate reductase
MRIDIPQARALLERVMRRLGHDAADAAVIADHLLDCELRGLHQGGFARAISIAERLERIPPRREPIRVAHETPVSARVEGGDHIGYVVARRATELAIGKARASGLSIVAANDTWYTGMLSYYAEMAVAQGLVAVIASNATAWVAPHGATEGRFGTNPICFGFPTTGTPMIWDIGISNVIHADVMLARRLGKALPEGVAYDTAGRLTTDPVAALAGSAFVAWGGAKGAGLGLVVQLLGIMAGSTTLPQDLRGFGFVVLLVQPGLLGDRDFPARAAEYLEWVRTARPLDASEPVRVPFERSARDRARRLAEGWLELPDVIHAALRGLADEGEGRHAGNG